jgi:hypothetical protein
MPIPVRIDHIAAIFDKISFDPMVLRLNAFHTETECIAKCREQDSGEQSSPKLDKLICIRHP